MEATNQSLWARANTAFRNKDYESAIVLYEEALDAADELLKVQIRFNYENACRRAGLQSSPNCGCNKRNTPATTHWPDLLNSNYIENDQCAPESLNKKKSFSFEQVPIHLKTNQKNIYPHDSMFSEWLDRPFTKWVNYPRHIKSITDITIENNHKIVNFGAAFLGPVFAAYFSKLANNLKSTNNIKKIWFLAREGYLLERSFNEMSTSLGLEHLETGYIYCSRTLLFRLSIFTDDLKHKTLRHHYNGSVENLFKNRYAFTSEEIWRLYIVSRCFRLNASTLIELPKDESLVLTILEEAKSQFEMDFLHKTDLYREYLKFIGFGEMKVEHVVDLGYSGTIQSLITDLTGVSTSGHYFITTKKAENTGKTRFFGYLANNINFGDGNALLDRSLFMESILTAPHGQVIDICKSSDGKLGFMFGEVTKAQQRYSELELIIEGAVKYACDAVRNNVVMNDNELKEYYSKFVESKSAFPRSMCDLFEIDDTISGFGIINPLSFFKMA